MGHQTEINQVGIHMEASSFLVSFHGDINWYVCVPWEKKNQHQFYLVMNPKSISHDKLCSVFPEVQ